MKYRKYVKCVKPNEGIKLKPNIKYTVVCYTDSTAGAYYTLKETGQNHWAHRFVDWVELNPNIKVL